MTLRGHIRNGTLVFDVPPAVPEVAAVEVDLRTVADGESGPTLNERYRDIIGVAEGPRILFRPHAVGPRKPTSGISDIVRR